VDRYSLEFKLTGVRLSEQPGIQVKAVAATLDIRPFMLSRRIHRELHQEGCRVSGVVSSG
jgi:transposase-like protein